MRILCLGLLNCYFLLLIERRLFTEFDPEGQAGNVMDTFFKIFYCGLIPIIFQWILFEFF